MEVHAARIIARLLSVLVRSIGKDMLALSVLVICGKIGKSHFGKFAGKTFHFAQKDLRLFYGDDLGLVLVRRNGNGDSHFVCEF